MENEKQCQHCGATFRRDFRQGRRSWEGRKFCSRACASRSTQPAAGTAGGATTKAILDRRRAELIEDVEWLLSWRIWPPEIAERLGLSVKSLERALARAKRHDLAANFRPMAYDSLARRVYDERNAA